MLFGIIKGHLVREVESRKLLYFKKDTTLRVKPFLLRHWGTPVRYCRGFSVM